MAASDAARRCGVVSCRATPGRRRKASREQAVALGRAADGLTAAGGAERCRIEVGSEVLAVATFVDPATGEPRVACGLY